MQVAENKNFYCYFAQIIFNIVVQFAQKFFNKVFNTFNKFSTSNLGKTFVILHKSFPLCEMFLCTLHKNFGLLSNIHDFQQSFQLFNIFSIFNRADVEKFSTFQLRAVENFCTFCTKNRVNRAFLLKIFVGMHNFGRARWKIFVQNAQKK